LLWLSWRDPWHPKSGGAELFTLRVAEQLVARGWSVEWFSAKYPGAAEREVRDGITFVRAGNQASVHTRAWLRYRRTRAFDIVVDEINTIPFYSMLYEIPSVTLMFQLAREVWLYQAPPGLAQLGYILERAYLRPYRHATILTISQSSVESFRTFGLNGEIHIIPIAVDERADSEVPDKAPERDAIVIGRIARSKRIEHALEAASILSGRGWKGRLHVVGDGEERYVQRLKKRADALPGCRAIFHGRVSDEQRSSLLRNASVLWMTSFREGWGLVVTEAARHGTPSVVYDTLGLRDAVINNVTGLVVEESPMALSDATEVIWKNFDTFSTAALAESRGYSWSATADSFEKVLRDAVTKRR
jgi:glycosyltransferase involved in cell wall biosynthesis